MSSSPILAQLADILAISITRRLTTRRVCSPPQGENSASGTVHYLALSGGIFFLKGKSTRQYLHNMHARTLTGMRVFNVTSTGKI